MHNDFDSFCCEHIPQCSRKDRYMRMYRRYIWNFLHNIIVVEGMPDSIDWRYFVSTIMRAGKVGFKDVAGIGLVCSRFTLGDEIPALDYQFKERSFKLVNPYLPEEAKSSTLVGADGVIVYNSTEYVYPYTFTDLVEITAERLTEAALSMRTSLRNSRISIVFACTDDTEAQRCRKIYDDLGEGEAATIITNKQFNDFSKNLFPISGKDSMIISELADAQRCIWAEFLNMLGIKNEAVDKKERVTVLESQSNSVSLGISLSIVLRAWQEGFDEVNRLFGTSISCRLNDLFDFVEEEGQQDDTGISSEEEAADNAD